MHDPVPKNFPISNDINRIAVIGAGCSGLAALKVSAENGLNNIVCFEKTTRAGGNWVYTTSESHSSVCETTHIISSNGCRITAIFPMPADYPDYPGHRQVLAYFQSYAKHFDLARFIRFNTEVKKVEKIENERWRIELGDGTAEAFDYLLVANGHHSVPRHPGWKDDFKGKYLHSHGFKNNRGFEGKRILVVGAGNSLRLRRRNQPGCRTGGHQRPLSAVYRAQIFPRQTDRHLCRGYALAAAPDTGLAPLDQHPDTGRAVSLLRPARARFSSPTQAHPTVNSEMLEKIRHGKVHPRPGIRRVEGQTVFFEDGASAEYDAIIAATGYRMRFPFFDKTFIDWEDATNVPLYLRVFHPEHKSLFFIGLVQPQGSVWPLSEAQARLVARHITGRYPLPANWQQLGREEGAAIERNFLKSPRHSVEVHFLPYLRKLEKLAKA